MYIVSSAPEKHRRGEFETGIPFEQRVRSNMGPSNVRHRFGQLRFSGAFQVGNPAEKLLLCTVGVNIILLKRTQTLVILMRLLMIQITNQTKAGVWS